MRRPTWRWCAMALLVGACDPGDSGDPDDAGDDMAGSEGDPDEPFPPDDTANDTADDTNDAEPGGTGPLSFSRDVAPLLSACSCHVGGAGGLKLGEEPYAALVGMPAFGSSLSYVEPGDVEASYLVHKLRGTQTTVGGSGSTMPPGGAFSEAQLTIVETWIAEGAVE